MASTLDRSLFASSAIINKNMNQELLSRLLKKYLEIWIEIEVIIVEKHAVSHEHHHHEEVEGHLVQRHLLGNHC